MMVGVCVCVFVTVRDGVLVPVEVVVPDCVWEDVWVAV